MKGLDKFLIGIIIGVVALVAIVLGVLLTQPEVDYLAEDTPEAVAHNYLLALQREDYERAYGYLSTSLKGRPASAIEFKRDVERYRWNFRTEESVAIAILSTDLLSAIRAAVDVRATHYYSGGLFSSYEYDDTFSIYLALESGQWKITNADSFFAHCWTKYGGCD